MIEQEDEDAEYISICDHKPIITYSGDEDLFRSVEATLIQSLSQESIEFKRSYGRSVKSVTLSAKFIPFTKDLLHIRGRTHLLKRPIFHIFWTMCADVDTYKTSVQEDIKAWMQILLNNNIADWMIVLVETYDFRKHNKLLPRATVLDKIKNDFGSKHADRCLSIINPLRSELRTGSSWRGLVANMRLLILNAYDVELLKLEELVRSQRESRNKYGWSFCKYFLLQEELAFVFEMLGLYDDALLQYDELDALFTQFIQNSSIGDSPSWLNAFANNEDTRCCAIVLTEKVNAICRQAIQEESVSLLELRAYLFSRQVAMLLRKKKLSQVAERTLPFLYNCLNEIKILEMKRDKGAIACWVFLCCIEVFYAFVKFSSDSSIVDDCSKYTPLLLEQATEKLSELGELCGLLPDCVQTSEQLHILVGLSASIGDPPSHIRNINDTLNSPIVKLKQALSSKESFRKYYIELSELAMAAFKHRERMRCSHLIRQRLADFYMRSEEYGKAIVQLNAILTSLQEHWPRLASDVTFKLMRCYKKLGKIGEYVTLCAQAAASHCLEYSKRIEYLREITDHIDECETLEITSPKDNAFNCVVTKCEVDSLFANVTLDVTSHFPEEVTLAQVEVEAIKSNSGKHVKIPPIGVYSRLPIYSEYNYQQDKSLSEAKVECKRKEQLLLRRSQSQKNRKSYSQGTRVRITKDNVSLKPGKNSLVLRSKVPEDGFYRLDRSNVKLFGKLNFLSNEGAHSKMTFEMAHLPPSICVLPSEEMLIAGIECKVIVEVNLASYLPSKGWCLKCRASEGLFIQTKPEESLSTCFEMEIETFQRILSLVIRLKAEYLSECNHSIISHSLNFSCPWTDVEISLPLKFRCPFVISGQLRSSYFRKYYRISLTSNSGISISLSAPSLVVKAFCVDKNEWISIAATYLNPSVAESVVLDDKKNVNFMWEINFLKDVAFRNSTLQFNMQYRVGSFTSNYSSAFAVDECATLYIIRNSVEPMTANEISRVNTMCFLSVHITRTTTKVDYSLMYEILMDQNKWAACNNSTGIVILDNLREHHFKLEIMPLVSGFLPIPIVKLRKYYPNDGISDVKNCVSQLESFNEGQVFDASGGNQVHVLPLISTPLENNAQ